METLYVVLSTDSFTGVLFGQQVAAPTIILLTFQWWCVIFYNVKGYEKDMALCRLLREASVGEKKLHFLHCAYHF